jgi:outer membrane protein insertion porin family
VRRLLLSVLLAAAALPGSAAGQEEEARGRPEVVTLEFSGNRTFPTDTLKRAIVNRETECRAWFLWGLCELDVDFADDRHYYHAEEFSRDAVRLRLYYWQRGFREAQVDTASRVLGPDEVALSFTIDEGRPVLVDSIAVVGGEELDPSLFEELPLQEGEPLSGLVIEATRDTIEHRLHEDGYAHALVLLRTELPEGTYTASVTFDVDPGQRARFGPIQIVGNDELSETVIRRMLGFEEGDLWGTSRILEAQRNLFGLEIVQYARVDSLPTSELDTIIPMRVEITESYEYRVRTGAGWSTADCLTTEARWSARNFMGGARRLQVRGRVANVLAESLHEPFCQDAGVGDYGRLNWLIAADFVQPWIFSPRNSLSLGIYGERTSLPDVFVRKAVGANVVLVRSLGRTTPLALSYRPQLSRLTAAEVFFCTSFLACAPEDIDVVQGANWLSPVGANLSTDRTDNLLNPRAGFRGAIDLEHANRWTGSNYAYNRALGEISAYQGVGASSVVAARLRAGWVGAGEFELLPDAGEVVHPLKRFFAGGSNSVRGYAQNRLGPKVLTVSGDRLLRTDSAGAVPVCTVAEVMALSCDAGVSRVPSGAGAGAKAERVLGDGAFTPQPTGGTRMVEGSVELRFPITPVLFEGVSFVDWGQVWAGNEKIELSDLVWTPGVGVRYYSPIGPIRLDLAYRHPTGERLRVVTAQVEPCVAVEEGDGCTTLIRGTNTGPGFLRVGELALLEPTVPFDRDKSFVSRLQLHFSIGQAF